MIDEFQILRILNLDSPYAGGVNLHRAEWSRRVFSVVRDVVTDFDGTAEVQKGVIVGFIFYKLKKVDEVSPGGEAGWQEADEKLKKKEKVSPVREAGWKEVTV